MAIERVNFDPIGSGGDNPTGALVKLDANCVDLDARATANAGSATNASTAAAAAQATADAAKTEADAASLALSLNVTFRNKLINGNWDFWNFGTSSSVAGYLADKWVNQVLGTGTTFNASRQAFPQGQTAVPNSPRWFKRIVVTGGAATSSGFCLQQRIEGVRTLAGENGILGLWMRSPTAGISFAVEYLQAFGGGNTSSVPVGKFTITAANTWQFFPIPKAIPALPAAPAVVDGTDYLQLGIWLDAGSDFGARASGLGHQSGTFDIAQVSLDAGLVFNGFDDRSLAAEAILVARFCNVGALSFQGAHVASATQYACRAFPVPMRAAPAMTVTQYVDNDGAGTSSATLNASATEIFSVTMNTGPTKQQARFYIAYRADANL